MIETGTRTALEIVDIYLKKIWNEGQADLVRTYCADPITRHDLNSVTRLTHDEQIARISSQYQELVPFFTDVVLAGDDTHITSVWNVTGKDPDWRLCGIEVFKVVDGRITDVWNSTYMKGHWGE